MRTGFLILAMLCSGPAYSKSLFLDLQPKGERQHARMDAGVEAVDSNLSHGSARLFENENKIGKRGQFSVMALNASDMSADLGSENITMTLADGTPIEVVSYQRLLKEVKNRQMWAAIAAGLGAASNSLAASQAGYSNGTASFSGSSYGRYGAVNSYGSTNFSGYNGAAAYAAQANANAQNQATFDRLAATNAAGMESLKSLLRTTTIDPGQSFGGLVTYELPAAARSSKEPVAIIIKVAFAGDEHEFVGTLVKR